MSLSIYFISQCFHVSYHLVEKVDSLWTKTKLCIKNDNSVDQDLSYDESLSGRPGAWLVKKLFIVCMQSQNLKKDFILKFIIIFRTSFVFMIAFMVYE